MVLRLKHCLWMHVQYTCLEYLHVATFFTQNTTYVVLSGLYFYCQICWGLCLQDDIPLLGCWLLWKFQQLMDMLYIHYVLRITCGHLCFRPTKRFHCIVEITEQP